MNVNEYILIVAAACMLLGIIAGVVFMVRSKNYDAGALGIMAVILTISFIGFLTLVVPTSRTEREVIRKEEVSAFQDDTYNQIYGKIAGNIFYIDGEISSSHETYITLVKIGDSGRVQFLNYKLSEVKLYLVDPNELEYPYVETSYYEVKSETKIFGKVVNTDYSTRDRYIKIYLPADSLQYDNKINN